MNNKYISVWSSVIISQVNVASGDAKGIFFGCVWLLIAAYFYWDLYKELHNK